MEFWHNMRVQQLELITCADFAVNRISSRNKPECLNMSHDWFMEREKRSYITSSYITSSCQGAKHEDGSTCFTHPEINACSPDVESILFLQSWCHFMLGRGITHVKDTFQGIYKPTAPTLFPYGNIQMHLDVTHTKREYADIITFSASVQRIFIICFKHNSVKRQHTS